MLNLRPINLRWIQDAVDDPADLCAHGDVNFRIGDDTLLSPDENGKGLTLSAAVLYLLRTLSMPHVKDLPVAQHLFPCCGFAMWSVTGQDDVVIQGCPNGADFEVLHQLNGEGVTIRDADGREWVIAWPQWREAVMAFAERIEGFYNSCSPKTPTVDDAPGYAKFWEEWNRRRGRLNSE